VLARELEICYAAIALVTDLDAGIDVGGGVKIDDVIGEFEKNIEPFKGLVRDAIGRVDVEHSCTDCQSHTGVTLPFDEA
jgi:5'-methylthioadenosine phosphorylase